MKTENYRACITDCEVVTKPPLTTPLPPIVRKSFFRMAKARISLNDLQGALQSLNTPIALDKECGSPEDLDFRKLSTDITSKIEQREQLARKRVEEARMQKINDKTLRNALQVRRAMNLDQTGCRYHLSDHPPPLL